MMTAEEYYREIQRIPPLSSGDPTLDRLLDGGFLKASTNLITGPPHLTSMILMNTAVNALKPRVEGGQEFEKIVYIDGENLFNPYYVSKVAVSNQLNPLTVLDQIAVARAFTWNQMVELVEEKLPDLEAVDLILIAGMTAMFEDAANDTSRSHPNNHLSPNERTTAAKKAEPVFRLNTRTFHDLQHMIDGIKKHAAQHSPTVVLTGPTHSKSENRPVGGNILAHYANIIIGIHDYPRFYRYRLEQHPFLSYREERFWKPWEETASPAIKRRNGKNCHNLTLDFFLATQKTAGGT
jgi:RecA/RadA recombinase